ncbi:hypothetical protein HOD08_02850 [bacterium]|nr:hypothetical protein [bacterium]
MKFNLKLSSTTLAIFFVCTGCIAVKRHNEGPNEQQAQPKKKCSEKDTTKEKNKPGTPHILVKDGESDILFESAKQHPDIAKKIATLIFNDHLLKTIPDEISLFTNLKTLVIKTAHCEPIEISESVGLLPQLSQLCVNAPCIVLPETLREKVCTPGSNFNLQVRIGPAFFFKDGTNPTCALVNFSRGPGKFLCNGQIYKLFMCQTKKDNALAFLFGVKVSQIFGEYHNKILAQNPSEWLKYFPISQENLWCGISGIECVAQENFAGSLIAVKQGTLYSVPSSGKHYVFNNCGKLEPIETFVKQIS